MTAPVTLADCPPGLFHFGDCLGFKSEYRTRLASHLYQTDAYVVESGEYFWGGTSDPAEREKLLVTPLDAATLKAGAPR